MYKEVHKYEVYEETLKSKIKIVYNIGQLCTRVKIIYNEYIQLFTYNY